MYWGLRIVHPTLSRVCMYSTCLSMTSLSSSGTASADVPPLPGPETNDMLSYAPNEILPR